MFIYLGCNSNKDCLYGYSCKDKVHNMGVSGTTIISKCVIESRGIFRESGKFFETKSLIDKQNYYSSMSINIL